MRSKLENLLEKIDPENTYDKVSAHVNNAFNSFQLKKSLITNISKFQEIGAEFHCHLQNKILQLNPPMILDFEMDWDRFHNLLVIIYGQNGEKTAFDIAISGKEGGLYTVLKTVADRMIEESASAMISSKIFDFLDSLTINEKILAVNEYIGTFGHLLPEEIIKNRAPRIAANFHKVLETHPRLIKRAREMIRKF